jgi:hypothetical protein
MANMVNFVKLASLKCCIVLLLIGAVAVVSTNSARSSAIWTFHETSCTALKGSNCTYQPPGGLAQLVLPGINSNGSWSFFYNSSTHMTTETGDTDFSFQLAGPSPSFQAPGFHLARPPDILADVDYEIAFASSASSLSIAVVYSSFSDAFCIRQGTAMVLGTCAIPAVGAPFLVATDSSFLLGCDFTECNIDGSWTLAFVPEPSSLAELASGLAGVLISLVLVAALPSPSRIRSRRPMVDPQHRAQRLRSL